MSRQPRPHFAIDDARLGGGAAAPPLVYVGAICERLSEGALAIDRLRRIMYINRAGCAILGVHPETVVGRDVLTLPSTTGRPAFENALAQVLDHAVERTLSMRDPEAPPFNADYCHLLPLAGSGALLLIGEYSAPQPATPAAEHAESAREERDTIAQIARELAGRGDDISTALRLLTDGTRRLLDADGALVMRLDGGALRVALVRGSLEAHGASIDTMAAGLADQAMRERRALSTNDVNDPRLDVAAVARLGIRHVAIAPIIAEAQVAGIVLAVNSARGGFTDDDVALLQRLADQGALAIRNARLIARAHRQAARLEAVSRAQLAVARTELADIHAEIQRAVVAAQLDAPCFALLLVDHERKEFAPQLVVVDGITTRAPALAPVPIGEDAASQAVREGHAVASIAPRLAWNGIVRGAPPRVPAAEIAAPIIHGDETLGALVVQSWNAAAYADDDAELLALIARQAAAALVNARSFAVQRDARELAEAAASIARVSLGAQGIEDVARAILDVLDRVGPSAGKAFALIDDAADAAEGALTYVAATGASVPARGLKVRLAESIGARAAAAREPVRIASEPGSDAADAPFARGGIVVPIAAQQRLLGLLLVSAAGGSTLSATIAETVSRLAAPMALALDVHVLGQEERRRRQREHMLAAALATMEQPVFILDLNRHVLYANEAAVREYGYTSEEFAGMPFDALVASASPIRSDFGPRDAARSDMYVAEHVHRRRDGSEFPASVTLGFARQESGQLSVQVLGVRNLTYERRITEQLRQNEKLAALGELVAGVAHELNNPLAGISAFAQLMLEEPLSDEQFESVRLIKREADRAVDVIRDLLIFARKTGPSSAPVSVNQLVQLTLRLRAYSLRTSGVEAITVLEPDLPDVAGDDQKLQQVLLNLIVNAEYAMQRSQNRRLTVRTTRHEGGVAIEVSDTGTGMSKETQERVFEPFFTTKPAGEGTGLGLSVSYGIIEAHGGTIAVASTPGRGTSFLITLPAYRAPAPDAEADIA